MVNDNTANAEPSETGARSSESDLLAAVAAGDTDAYGHLVERYQDRLYQTMWGILGSREDARDIVQEAFVQAYLKLDSFRAEARFYTWLYRIATNLAWSQKRRKRPTISWDRVREQAGVEPVDRQAGPEGLASRREQIEKLWVALDQMPRQAREILVLRELEGCSYEAIGEILKLPVGTVRSRLFRARARLRSQFQGALPEEAGES